MLEGHSPNLDPLNECIRDVFTSMFTICGIAMDYKKQMRFKTWLRRLRDGGGDPALSTGYTKMEKAIQTLSQAVGIATLRTVSIVDEKATRIEDTTTRIEEISEQNNDLALGK